ncbi:MAG: UDP-N-acetyl-D-glucosamine dehydrogenase [Desulfobacteraceae bacterium CG2_30_51_40]|nr:MAG: UDP-N-acetyl-D-glucosamine dehydrogenase [Desulfobacteraceae bacterium CG2_30_51_40]
MTCRRPCGGRKLALKKVRIGVIGVGHLGTYHLQKYKNMEDVELVGIVDVSEARAAEIADKFCTRVFRSHNELLDQVEAVSLAVPTEEHYVVAKDILNRKVHLLIEKPITYDLTHADTLIGLADKNALVFQVGLVERFNPAVVRMEELLTKPVLVESHRMNEFTVRGIDVDVVLDLMIHDLDIILHIIKSEVQQVHAVGMSVLTGKTDIANARLIFTDGTVANLTASRVSNKTLRKIRVFQPDAYLSVNCAKRKIGVIRLDGQTKDAHGYPQVSTKETLFTDSDPLADEIASFVRAVASRGKPVVTGRDGRKALAVALQIIGQIERGIKDYQPY